MKLGEVLLTALKDYGAREIFGIPGDFVIPFFKIMEDTNILPFYTFSHEPAVGFAADSASRYHTGLGVAVVTYGAGAFNSVNAIACAYAEKSPVVIISGAPGTEEDKAGYLLHHQAKTLDSQFNVFKEITCAQLILNDEKIAAEEIARVLKICKEESRPVYIELPRNMVDIECKKAPILKRKAVNIEAVTESAKAILRKLQKAKQPVLIVGVEARRYKLEDKIAKLAKKLSIPVATTFMGRGLLTKQDCPFMGTYLGLAGEEYITNYVEDADAILMLGVILADTNFGISKRRIDMRKVVNASDGQVNFGHYSYPEIPLGDLIDVLLDMAEPLRENISFPEYSYPKNLVADNKKLVTDDICRVLNDLFEKHEPMTLISDVGDCLFAAMDINGAHLIASAYYVTMGFAVPAGMGLELSTGRRPVILVGDGAFQMTGMELGHCKRYGLKPIVIVFNNDGWEMMRTFQDKENYCQLGDWNYAKLADILGGRGYRVKTRKELADAVDIAYADTDRFSLIEVMLGKGEISGTLKRFTEGIKAFSSGKN